MLRRLALLAVLATALPLLAGCVPQSREDLDRYIVELRENPAVESIDYGVSTPLPFSVQASATVTLTPELTKASLEAFTEEACAREVNASVHFELVYELATDAFLRHDVGSRCYFERTTWIDALPVLRENGAETGDVDWSVLNLDDGEQTRIGLDSEGVDAARQSTLADALLGALTYTGGDYEVTTSDLEVEADYDQTRAVFQGLAELGALYPIVTARYEEGLIVQIDTSLAEIAEEAEAWFTTAHPDVPVVQFLDLTVEVGNGVPSADTIEVSNAIRETGLAEEIRIDQYGLYVRTADPATSLSILDEIGSLADGVAIKFISPLPLGASVGASSDRDASASEQRLRLELAAELYAGLKDDPTVGGIVVDRLGVEVQTTEELWRDDATIKRLQDVVADIVERNGLNHHYVNVNNRPVRGYTD